MVDSATHSQLAVPITLLVRTSNILNLEVQTHVDINGTGAAFVECLELSFLTKVHPSTVDVANTNKYGSNSVK